MEIDNNIIKDLLTKKNIHGLKMYLNSFVYSFYNDTITRFNNGEDLTFIIPEIEHVLMGLDFIYISGDISPLKDVEYDELYNIFVSLTGRYLTNKNENFNNRKISHKYPLLKGTIEKVHHISEEDKKLNNSSRKSLEKFIITSIKNSGLTRDIFKICLYPKFDGVSVIFEIEDGKVVTAITRGDAETGLGTDVTHMFKSLEFQNPLDNMPSSYGMKSEIVLNTVQFLEFSNKYGNDTRKLNDPRSAASCIMSTNVNFPDEWLKYITIVPLMYEINGEFVVPSTYLGMNLVGELEIDISNERYLHDLDIVINDTMRHMISNELDIECDGIVIRFADPDLVKILGRDMEKCINKYEIAFKYPANFKTTILEDIEFSIGLMGKVSAVAKIKPVIINNRTIKSVSLGSIDRFKTLKLCKNEEVIIRYEIIPYLDKSQNTNSTGEIFALIDECPHCGTALEYNPELMCVNNQCPSRIMGRIYNYCSKIGIDNIGEQTVEDFFNVGLLKSIPDLYNLESKTEVLLQLDGYGEKKLSKIFDSINSKTTLESYKFLGSLGIPSIGRKMFQKICETYTLDELLGIKEISKLTVIKGIKDATANQVIEGIQENLNVIESLRTVLNILEKSKKEETLGAIVFTNVRNSKFEEHLVSIGYEIGEAVNKKTTYVIADTLETVTGKTKKAIELNIPILDIATAYKKFNY